MPVNRINATLTPEQAQNIQAALAVLLENLPFLIDVTPQENKDKLKFAEINRPSSAKVYADAHETSTVAFNLDPIRTDAGLVETLNSLLHKISIAQNVIEDVYFAAFSLYQQAKSSNQANNSLDDAFEDLGQRLSRLNPGANPPTRDRDTRA